jgi:hypothetical protein
MTEEDDLRLLDEHYERAYVIITAAVRQAIDEGLHPAAVGRVLLGHAAGSDRASGLKREQWLEAAGNAWDMFERGDSSN